MGREPGMVPFLFYPKESRVRIKYHNYTLAVPTILALAFFYYLPSLFGVAGSLFYWTMDTMEWNNWANYGVVLNNPFISISFLNSLVFTLLATTCKTLMGFFLALLIDRIKIGSRFLRSVFFLPAILSTIAVGAVFSMFLHPTLGIVNKTLFLLGFPADMLPSWLTNASTAMGSVVFIETWMWTGFIAAIVLAALQAVPKDYYEAATIDGASYFKQQIAITIPCIWPTLANVVIYQLIMGVKVFDLILVTTNGGPGVTTKMLSQVVYENITSDMGTASAANTIMMLLIIVLALVGNGLLNRKEQEV